MTFCKLVYILKFWYSKDAVFHADFKNANHFKIRPVVQKVLSFIVLQFIFIDNDNFFWKFIDNDNDTIISHSSTINYAGG